MRQSVDAVIFGSGTAALAAADQIAQVTERFRMISNGVYGTTCVRAGCMPSKVFIQGAQYFQLRRRMPVFGISETGGLSMDRQALLRHVREMRSRFLAHTLKHTEHYRERIIEGDAFFHALDDIDVGGMRYAPRRVVLATGSSPILPPSCTALPALTTDSLFEQETLSDAVTVVGMSVLGTEMAQAFAQLGMRVTALHDGPWIGGLSDPAVNDYALTALREEMEIILHDGEERMYADACLQKAECLFVAMSRKANLEGMGLERCGITASGEPVLDFDPETMQVKDSSVFVAGDVKLGRSILNEAADEGKIAGYNAARATVTRFRRRTPLQIVYTDPVIAVAGKSWAECDPETTVAGEARYDDQGRAKIRGTPRGILRLYAERKGGLLLGCEMFAPGGEHLAHMLAWLIGRKTAVEEALQLAFYHPSLEEGVKTALEELAGRVEKMTPLP